MAQEQRGSPPSARLRTIDAERRRPRPLAVVRPSNRPGKGGPHPGLANRDGLHLALVYRSSGPGRARRRSKSANRCSIWLSRRSSASTRAASVFDIPPGGGCAASGRRSLGGAGGAGATGGTGAPQWGGRHWRPRWLGRDEIRRRLWPRTRLGSGFRTRRLIGRRSREPSSSCGSGSRARSRLVRCVRQRGAVGARATQALEDPVELPFQGAETIAFRGAGMPGPGRRCPS